MNFEAVLAGLPDAVIAVDSDLRIIFWNSAAEVLTERSARRAEGRYIKEVFSPDASVVRRLGETLATGESRSEAESFIERVDGRRVPVSVITAPLCGRDGQVEAAVVVLRDLSRIHQLEAEVRRGETLAAAGRMAVGLAHEVRNPLAAIRGAVQLLGREIGPDSRLREYTDVLLTEVDRVNRIIEMLLDLARPIQLRAVPLNLHQLLERVTLLNEEGARERSVTMIRRYDPSLPPILGDEDRLLQVFHNLVRNALDAMERGGRLTLTTRVSLNPLFGKMDLGTGQRSMVEAQVADEGAGIPAGVRARIFDPFFTTKDKGLGLGLSICHRILEEHRGAYDYLGKPFDLDEVLLLTERALTARRLTQEVSRLKSGLQEVWEFGAIIGRHPRMQEVYKTIGRVAASDVTVLLRGESGTGKELVARAIHHYSRRAGRPFVAVSSAAIPGTLLESELFGHERGAFTDAKERKLGKLELAHGGTLFLDEIGDMPPELQTKLLRALQERTIERVGGQESLRIDVRVLAATNRDLETMMREGRFREDLFYRLNVVTVTLPPLSETGGNQVRAAQILGINRNTLRKKLTEHGIEPDSIEG